MHFILMSGLLVCSAFFSGTETAFFSLSRRQIHLLKNSPHRLALLAAKLLDEPDRLLACLLLGNTAVNVLFYAVASVLTVSVEKKMGVAAASICGVGSFVVLVVFGEILPKSLAYANAKSLAILTTGPLFLLTKILGPIQVLLRMLVVTPILRLILGTQDKDKPLSNEELKHLIDQISRRGLITADETRIMGEIIEFGYLKVRHVMQPRVDMIACDISDGRGEAQSLMQKNNLTKIAIFENAVDNILGLIYHRDLLLNPQATLKELTKKVNYVPEQQKVESLLEFFRKSGTDMAIVVDEYGGIAGSVSLSDIAEELIGPLEGPEEIDPIKQVGPFGYRLAGSISMHDWSSSFGISFQESRFVTLGGMVSAKLGRIAKNGDELRIKNLKFTVESVRNHRIETLILSVEPLDSNGK